MDNNDINEFTTDEQKTLVMKLLASKLHQAKRSPLSFSQERIWSITQLNPDNTSFNISNAMYIFGALDEALLEKSLHEVIRRQEILRSLFLVENGQPVQVVLPIFSFKLKGIDLGASATDEATLEQQITSERKQSFDLSKDLPFRATLLQLSKVKYILVLILHQIVIDAESWPIIIGELGSVYQAFKQGTKPALPNLAMQYADYAVWQRERLQGQFYTHLKEYWFHKYLEPIDPLQLPADRLPASQLAYADTTAYAYKFNIGPETLHKLKQFAGQEKVSLFVLLLTTFNCLLYMYTNQEHFLIFTSVSAKNRPELKALVGLFSNLVPIQVNIGRGQNVKQILESIHEEVNAAVAHQEFPFDKITAAIKMKIPEQQISSRATSLFQVMFTFRYADQFDYDLGDIRLEPIEMALEKEFNFQMRLGMKEMTSHIECNLTYNAAVFEASTIGQIARNYLALLDSSLNEVHLPLSELPVFQPIERHCKGLAEKRLAEIQDVQPAPYIAPRDETETKLALLWQEILGVEKAGVHDNFFELGGHSLNATLLINGLRREFKVEVSLQQLFLTPTIEALAAYLTREKPSAAPPPGEEGEDSKAPRIVKITDNWPSNAVYRLNTPEIKELTIEIQRDITINSHRALPLCVILADPNLRPWYYEHYINIFAKVDDGGYLNLDFLEVWAPYREIINESSLGAAMMAKEPDIIKFIITHIEQGNYLNIAVDECYLPGTRRYQIDHFVRHVLVYGYNNIERSVQVVSYDANGIFGAMAFSYEVFTGAYEQGKLYYRESAPWAARTAVQLFYSNGFHSPYPFNIHKFLMQLHNYLFSIGDDSIIYFWTYKPEQVSYGFQVYSTVLQYLQYLLQGRIKVDFRAVHLLYEQKKAIAQRLEFIMAKYKIQGRLCDQYYEFLKIVADFDNLRLKMIDLQFQYKSLVSEARVISEKVAIVQQMMTAIVSVTEQERTILLGIYEELKTKFSDKATGSNHGDTLVSPTRNLKVTDNKI